MSLPCWLFRIMGALDGGGAPHTLRFTDGSYFDSSDNLYIKRLNNPGLITVSPNDGGVLKIFSDVSIGETELNNADGGLDYLSDYAIDGRLAEVDYFNGTTVTNYFSGTCAGIRESSGKIFISMRTIQDRLNSKHPYNTYLGNNTLPNGVEGVTGDIQGNMKPRNYGAVQIFKPVIVNTSKLIYQCNDRGGNGGAVLVLDRGATLTRDANYASLSAMLATAPAAGHWAAFEGYIRLGSASTGTITCLMVELLTGVTVIYAGDLIQRVLDEYNVTVSAAYQVNLDATSKTLLNTFLDVSFSVTTPASTNDIFKGILSGLGVYWYIDAGYLYARKLALATVSVFDVLPDQIKSIERAGTGLGKNGIPIKSALFNYSKIEFVQNDLNNTVVSPVVASNLANEWRSVKKDSVITLSRHPLAEDVSINSSIIQPAIIDTVATDYLSFVSVKVDIIDIEIIFSALPTIVIGDGFTVYSSNLGYSAGKLLTIISYTLDIKNKTVKIGAIG